MRKRARCMYLLLFALVMLVFSKLFVIPSIAYGSPEHVKLILTDFTHEGIQEHTECIKQAQIEEQEVMGLSLEMIKRTSEKYGIDADVVLAVIYVESRGNPNAIGDNGNSIGLMQIQPKWHQERMDKLGVNDLLDPEQNIEVGCSLLGELYWLYGNIEMTLSAYNTGDPYEGIEYAQNVLEEAKTFRQLYLQ